MSNLVTYNQSPFNKTRKDKFLLVLSIPEPLKQISSKFDRTTGNILPDTLQFSVYGGVVPEINVPAVQNRYAGQTLAVTSHSREPYTPLTVNFTVDNRFNNYWVIYSWLNLLNNDRKSGYDGKDLTYDNPTINNLRRDLYKTTVTIYALDEYNKRVMQFQYTDAFPTNLGGINYSYRDSGELESSVTFSFSQFIAIPITEEIENL